MSKVGLRKALLQDRTARNWVTGFLLNAQIEMEDGPGYVKEYLEGDGTVDLEISINGRKVDAEAFIERYGEDFQHHAECLARDFIKEHIQETFMSRLDIINERVQDLDTCLKKEVSKWAEELGISDWLRLEDED